MKIKRVVLMVLWVFIIGHARRINHSCKSNDGALDTTFGNHGTVTTSFMNADGTGRGVVVLPCGTIVVAGDVSAHTTGLTDFALVGYTVFGTVDTRFGNQGIELTDFAMVLSQAGIKHLPSSSFDQAYAVAVQHDCDGCNESCNRHCNNGCNTNCKIVVVGSSTVFGDLNVAVARYNCDGTLDTSFGINHSGVTVIPVGCCANEAFAVALQDDNKIVIAGYGACREGNNDFAVMRLNCDGTLDRTFGCDRSGIVLFDFGGTEDVATAVQIQRDGKIVVGGYSNARRSFDFALVRFTPDGSVDRTFGDICVKGCRRTGRVLTDFSGNGFSSDQIKSLVLVENCDTCCEQESVRIIAVGFTSTPESTSFAVAGYTDRGCLDINFGKRGLVTTTFPGSLFSGAQAALLEHGCAQKCKIVVAGVAGFSDTNTDFALARYTLGGMLDTSFGNGGRVTTPFLGESADVANALALQENGDVIAAGFTQSENRSFALARYKVCNSCCISCGLRCATCTPCHVV